MKKLLIVLLLSVVYHQPLHAIDTFDEVAKIFETKCAGCHEGSNPQGKLNLVQPLDDLYAELVDNIPTNPHAIAKGYRQVDPGYPERSFLYRKIDGGMYHTIDLENAEGKPMPTNGNELTEAEKELVRLWILHGAPKDRKVVDPQVLEDYFAEGGSPRVERPEAPSPDEGFQLYLGTIYLEPGEEREYIYNYELNNPEPIEVYRLDTRMNQQSHHFILFKFEEGEHLDEDDGLEEVTLVSSLTGEAINVSNDTRMISAWAYSRDVPLPEQVAYKWDANTVLKFNYHIKNYSETSISPVEVYINVYTQPVGTALHEMHSDFLLMNPSDLAVTPGESSFDWTQRYFPYTNGSNDSVHIWFLGGHTHQLGTDFDVYKREANGSIGEQIYEGFYNFDYSFNQGFYDYAEPAVRIFDDFYSIRARDGLYMEAEYFNPTNKTVTFGLTTDDEMFGIFIQYVVGDISNLSSQWATGIEDESTASSFDIYPNPSTGPSTISYSLNQAANVQLEIFSTNGQRVALIQQGHQSPGDYSYSLAQEDLAAGVYMVQLQMGEEVITEKLVISK